MAIFYIFGSIADIIQKAFPIARPYFFLVKRSAQLYLCCTESQYIKGL